MTFAVRRTLVPLLLAGMATQVVAQNSTSPQNGSAPQVIPGLGNFSLPGSPVPIPRSTPAIVTRPTPTPTPSATSSTQPMVVPRATPTTVPPARATPVPRATPTPTATPSSAATRASPATQPTPEATTPVPIETPLAVPTPEPTSTPAATAATPVAESASPFPVWAVAVGLLIVVLGAIGFLVLRKRRRDADAEVETWVAVEPAPAPVPDAPEPAPTPAPPPAPAAKPVPAGPAPAMLAPRPVSAAGPAAKLEVALQPKRAGTNLTGAAVEYDIVITNAGDAPATGIRLDARLMSASAEQDRVIGMLFADTIERSNVVPFDLGPGETVSLGGKAILPRESVAPLRAGDKVLFVPVLVVNLRYGRGDGEGQTGRAFMIGAARGGDTKLAPFPLDTPRMRTDVAALPYTLKIDR